MVGMAENIRAPARINPDSPITLSAAIVLIGLLMIVSFTMSSTALMDVARWAAIPRRLAWALPVLIDGAIIVFTLAMLIFRARGESTVFAWSGLAGFTGVSVAANAAHAAASGEVSDWRTWVGAALAGLTPGMVALIVHLMTDLGVAPPDVAQVEGLGVRSWG